MALPGYAFFKGRIVPYSEARVGVLTHGLNYGTGVFSGIRGYWNPDEKELYVFRPEDHYRRFLESARMLGMELPWNARQLSGAAAELIRAEDHREDCYLRSLAFYGDETVGVRLHDLTPEVSIVAIPYGRYIEKEEGAHATISSWRRVDDNAIPARGKIVGAYVNSALAKSEAMRAGFDDAIVLTQDGHISEGSAANFMLVRDGVVITPPITDNILEGITRRTVMELLDKEMGITVLERSIDRSEIYVADEAFFVGTGVQIVAITRVDHRPIGNGRIGPIGTALRDIYFRVVRGRHPAYQAWCSGVYGGTAAREKTAMRLAEPERTAAAR
ncbi:MAG TPA: branched-chain amino acid transaminase [Thermoanaerobaculia bacterium]|nr:branched-chain amino acid transaminase [Thermoanaerobaculia bacterium]